MIYGLQFHTNCPITLFKRKPVWILNGLPTDFLVVYFIGNFGKYHYKTLFKKSLQMHIAMYASIWENFNT